MWLSRTREPHDDRGLRRFVNDAQNPGVCAARACRSRSCTVTGVTDADASLPWRRADSGVQEHGFDVNWFAPAHPEVAMRRTCSTLAGVGAASRRSSDGSSHPLTQAWPASPWSRTPRHTGHQENAAHSSRHLSRRREHGIHRVGRARWPIPASRAAATAAATPSVQGSPWPGSNQCASSSSMLARDASA